MFPINSDKRQELSREKKYSIAKGTSLILVCFIAGVLLASCTSEKFNASSIILRGIAVTLISSPALAYGIRLYQQDELREETRQTIKDAFSTHFTQQDELESAGVQRMYSKVPSDEINLAISETKKDDVVRFVNTWIPDAQLYAKSLRDAQARGVHIKILLIDPGCPVIVQRARDLKIGFTPEIAEARVQSSVQELGKLLVGIGDEDSGENDEVGRAQLKYYRSVPSIAVYGAGRTLFTGSFWAHQQAVEGTCLQCGVDGYIGGDIIDHFDHLWENSTSRATPQSLISPEKCAPFSKIYYLSTAHDGSSRWRYLNVNVRDLIHRDATEICEFKDPDVTYLVSFVRSIGQIEMHMTGRTHAASDHNIAVFPVVESGVSQSVLRGIMSHLDFRPQVALDPVLLFTDASHEQFTTEFSLSGGYKSGEIVDDAATESALIQMWNPQEALGPGFLEMLNRNVEQTKDSL